MSHGMHRIIYRCLMPLHSLSCAHQEDKVNNATYYKCNGTMYYTRIHVRLRVCVRVYVVFTVGKYKTTYC